MKVIINGASGRMGAMLLEACKENNIDVVAKVAIDYETAGDCYQSLSEVPVSADCLIDFSNHAATNDVCSFCEAKKMPVVLSTTGQTEEENSRIAEASKIVPVFRASNMSIGVAVVAQLAKKLAAAFPNADIEIVETHHNQKLDAPSGTALSLAQAMQEARPGSSIACGRSGYGKREKMEIGIQSVRLGNEVGTHEILVSTGSETITLKHKAESRMLFADGALKAAQWLIRQQPGLYGMNEMMGE